MTPEQIWLLKYGRGWVDWWELEDKDGNGLDALFERLGDEGKLKSDPNGLRVRLKTEKERDELIRV